MDTAIAAPNSDITEELLTAQALALYADIEQLLCIGEEIKTTGSRPSFVSLLVILNNERLTDSCSQAASSACMASTST